LTRDPELRYTPDGKAICKITLATNYGTREKPDVCFIDVTLWEKAAETVAQYCAKGDPLCITGRLKQENWIDQNTGGKRSKHVIQATGWPVLLKSQPRDQAPHPADEPEQQSGAAEGKAPF
jgi:single-strand DNA-binding protein